MFISTQNCLILLSYLTTTKLCHIKRNRLENYFYVSLEKETKNCDTSATVWPISVKFGTMTENLFLNYKTVKNQFQKSKMADSCRLEKWNETPRYLMMIQNGSVRLIGCPSFLDLKTIFWRPTHLTDTFCIVMSSFVEIGHTVSEISYFFAFFFWWNVKNSLNDRT